MTIYWGRVIRLTVGDLVVENLRMSFDIELLAAPGAGASQIHIWNLAPKNEEEIVAADTPVRLEAGYTGRVSVIYEGQVFRASVKRTGLDRITTLLVTSHQAVTSSAVITHFWKGVVQLSEIAGYIANAMGLELVAGQALNGIVFEDYALQAPAPRAMTLVLAKGSRLSGQSLSWRRDGNALHIYRGGESGLPLTRVVSEATGMVGSPERTDRGADVAIVLDEVPNIGDTVRLESSVLTGDWTVIGINYVGDNWQGDFLVRLQLGDPNGTTGEL